MKTKLILIVLYIITVAPWCIFLSDRMHVGIKRSLAFSILTATLACLYLFAYYHLCHGQSDAAKKQQRQPEDEK